MTMSRQGWDQLLYVPQNTSRCHLHLPRRWSRVTGRTVWDWWPQAAPKKPGTELNYLHWTEHPEVPVTTVGGHVGDCLTNDTLLVCPNIFNSLFPGNHMSPWGSQFLCACHDYHDTASGLEGIQISFNLLARAVLGLSWCHGPGKKIHIATDGGGHLAVLNRPF